MIRTAFAAALLTTTASAALAGGIERSSLSTAILFAEGNRMELSFASIQPDVSGVQDAIGPLPAVSSGDVAGDYTTLTFGYKNQLTDQLSFALIVDQPIGADVNYAAGTGYLYGGSTATIDSLRATALLGYEVQPNITVYGGLMAQQAEGEVALFNGYQLETSKETDFGYVVGAAWEKPEIAARVALTYQSSVTHDFDATETVAGVGVFPTTFASEVPQSVTLEFQTGIAPETLLFGSVKWTDWSVFTIAPDVQSDGVPDGNSDPEGGLVSYEDDVWTYNLGVGRRFSEEWSGAITASYEKAGGGFVGNLGPTDGSTSLGVAVTRTFDDFDVTLGARYVWIGDAETEAPLALTGGAPGVRLGDFNDNDGLAIGLRVGWNF